MGRSGRESQSCVDADAQAVEVVAHRLREIERLSGWSRTCAIGELMLESFFCGSIENFRTRTRERQHSLRRLAQHPACPLKKSALAEAVAVYIFVRENPQIRQFPNIAPGHVALVHRRGAEQAVSLLERASEQDLGVKALARSLNAGTKVRASAPRTAGLVMRTLRSVEQCLESLVMQVRRPDVWARLEEERLASSLSGLRAQLSEIGRLIDSLRSGANGAGVLKTDIKELCPLRVARVAG